MEKYLYSDRKILENEAELCNDKIKDHTDCQECGEDYLFMMKDNYHEFSIGLSTILSCLAMAEKEGAVPKIPYEWWSLINRRYWWIHLKQDRDYRKSC